MIRLYIEDPQGHVKQIEVEEDEFTIGRDKDNSLVLPERTVSRHQVRIFKNGDKWMVEDAGSRYGTIFGEEFLEQPVEFHPDKFLEFAGYRIKRIRDKAPSTVSYKVSSTESPASEASSSYSELFQEEEEEEVFEKDSSFTWKLLAVLASLVAAVFAGVLGYMALSGANVKGDAAVTEKIQSKKKTVPIQTITFVRDNIKLDEYKTFPRRDQLDFIRMPVAELTHKRIIKKNVVTKRPKTVKRIRRAAVKKKVVKKTPAKTTSSVTQAQADACFAHYLKGRKFMVRSAFKKAESEFNKFISCANKLGIQAKFGTELNKARHYKRMIESGVQ